MWKGSTARFWDVGCGSFHLLMEHCTIGISSVSCRCLRTLCRPSFCVLRPYPLCMAVVYCSQCTSPFLFFPISPHCPPFGFRTGRGRECCLGFYNRVCRHMALIPDVSCTCLTSIKCRISLQGSIISFCSKAVEFWQLSITLSIPPGPPDGSHHTSCFLF